MPELTGLIWHLLDTRQGRVELSDYEDKPLIYKDF